MQPITIRQALHIDLTEMRQLFANTINAICKENYNPEQLSVWAAGAENPDRWEQVFATQLIFVAEQDHHITGFSTLCNGNYIDLFYVHKDHQRQGIATALYNKTEQAAISLHQNQITADVSITAKPFFQKMGFTIQNKQHVNVKGIELINFKMLKTLA
ncbi:GNAT family N-acetyltransferase [Chitinophaga silvisoli]|uniref:GNAT family N-acetyltransferase n=1 Tax=Chitinophaga silvisoli TaxID=2291814 RepID=UPI0018F24141|nr:GNAT family N-acetyltransferase [Chitinophaga silvisoli]